MNGLRVLERVDGQRRTLVTLFVCRRNRVRTVSGRWQGVDAILGMWGPGGDICRLVRCIRSLRGISRVVSKIKAVKDFAEKYL